MQKLNKFISVITKAFVFTIILIFFISNGKMVDVNLIFLTISISVQLFFVVVLVCGILIGYLIGAKHKKLLIKNQQVKQEAKLTKK